MRTATGHVITVAELARLILDREPQTIWVTRDPKDPAMTRLIQLVIAQCRTQSTLKVTGQRLDDDAVAFQTVPDTRTPLDPVRAAMNEPTGL